MTEPRKSVVKRGLALVALVMALAILASLGTWQAGRYLMRRDIFDRMEEHLPQAIVTVDSATDFAEIPEFRRVRLEGGSLALEHTALIPRRFHKHLPGAWVLAPYVFADGSVVFVQRGWIPEHMEDAPPTSAPDAPLVGLVQMSGIREDVLAREYAAAGRFDLQSLPRLGDLDVALLYDTLDAPRPRADLLVVLGDDYREHASAELPTATYDHITRPYLTPMTHFGYAFLWYGAALLLVWIFWAGWTGRLARGSR